MGKHTLGDFTKTAREAAKKGGIFSKVSLKVRGTTTVTGLCGTFPHLFVERGMGVLLLLLLLLVPCKYAWRHFVEEKLANIIIGSVFYNSLDSSPNLVAKVVCNGVF